MFIVSSEVAFDANVIDIADVYWNFLGCVFAHKNIFKCSMVLKIFVQETQRPLSKHKVYHTVKGHIDVQRH